MVRRPVSSPPWEWCFGEERDGSIRVASGFVTSSDDARARSDAMEIEQAGFGIPGPGERPSRCRVVSPIPAIGGCIDPPKESGLLSRCVGMWRRSTSREWRRPRLAVPSKNQVERCPVVVGLQEKRPDRNAPSAFVPTEARSGHGPCSVRVSVGSFGGANGLRGARAISPRIESRFSGERGSPQAIPTDHGASKEKASLREHTRSSLGASRGRIGPSASSHHSGFGRFPGAQPPRVDGQGRAG